MARARCTVVWDWGDYRTLFDDDTDWMPYAAPMDRALRRLIPGYHHIRHLGLHEGGNRSNRRVPLTTHRHIAVTTCYIFGAAEEEPLHGGERAIFPWLPRPTARILDRVQAFRRDHFPPRTVGFHIRRTDNRPAVLGSPYYAYFRRADRLIARGYHLFLATDNEDTGRTLQERYGARLIRYPKKTTMERRWPRPTSSYEDIVDDIVDLWLLASCEFVVGSAQSSYSRVAMLLNDSPRCELIDSRWRRWLGLQVSRPG